MATFVERPLDSRAGADVPVMQFAVPQDSIDRLRSVRAPPDIVGRIARDAGVGHLVLSHSIAAPPEIEFADSLGVPKLAETSR